MKPFVSLAAVAVLVFGFRAAALEAIPSYVVGTAYAGTVPGGAGFAFTAQTNMAITALGFNGRGLATEAYRVGLWANGQQLVSVVVTTNSSFINQTYYEPITAVQLARGQVYYLSATGTNRGLWVGNIIQTYMPPQSFTVSADIAYLANAYGTNSAGQFPSGTGDPTAYYVAPDFQYSIGGGTNLLWAGTTGNQWDVGVSLNWLNLANNLTSTYYDGDTVLFDDTPGVQTNVSIPTGVAVLPLVMTNNSSTNNFTLSGGGRISGMAFIVKDGSSTLTLGTTNDFTASVLVLGGKVIVGCSNALGATAGPTIVTNSATLDLNGVNLGFEPVVVSGAGISGGGALVNNGPQTAAVSRLMLNGSATLGGSNRWDLGGFGPASLLTGGQPLDITKVGFNQVSFVGVNLIDPALRDIDIQQGTLSLQSTNTQLGNPVRFITVHSNATLSFNNLAATPLNKRVVLNDGAIVFNESGPSVVAGPVGLNGTNCFSVSSNGFPATLTFTNVISGTGSLWKIGDGTLVLAANNTYSGSTLVSTGTVALTGSGSIGASPAIVLSRGAALDVSTLTNGMLSLAPGQVLSGDGTVFGSLTAAFGSTVSPGRAIGLLTVTNDIVLLGRIFMELDKANATNDVLQAGTNLVYGGTLALTNVSGALAPGDSFKLFSAANYTGAFTNFVPHVAGSGLGWDTNQLTTNGILSVVLTPPVITNTAAVGLNLVIAGTNGMPTNTYYVLASTNVSLPLTNWVRIGTNLFDAAGNFVFTNVFDRSLPHQFFLLQLR